MKPCKRGHTSGRYKDNTCKQCASDQSKKWSKDNKERVNAHSRARYAANGERQRAYSRERARRLNGLPDAPYEPVGYCEACGSKEPGGHGNSAWRLDHCHETNRFRGWLCNKCNIGFGMLGDSVIEIEKRLEYLRRFENVSKISRVAEDSSL